MTRTPDDMPATVPEGAVVTDPAEWQELYALFANAGVAHDVADRAFTDVEFHFKDGEMDDEQADAFSHGLLAAGVPTVYQIAMGQALTDSGRYIEMPVAAPA